MDYESANHKLLFRIHLPWVRLWEAMGKIQNPAGEIKKAGERLRSRRLSGQLDTLTSIRLDPLH